MKRATSLLLSVYSDRKATEKKKKKKQKKKNVKCVTKAPS